MERLVRHCARPPFALERLHAPDGIAPLGSPDGRLLLRFPKPTPDGRTQILLSPLQLLERLAAFIPPPRIHRNRYHGVLAPNARLRPAVVAIGRPGAHAPDGDNGYDTGRIPLPATGNDEPGRTPTNQARIRWAVILARIYEVLPLPCPSCGGEMKILAFLTDPPVFAAILLHLELPLRRLSLRSPSGAPRPWLFGQPRSAHLRIHPAHRSIPPLAGLLPPYPDDPLCLVFGLIAPRNPCSTVPSASRRPLNRLLWGRRSNGREGRRLGGIADDR